MKAGNKLTAVADDALGHAQRRVGRHLDGPQMSSLEPHCPQNPRSIQWRVIPQNPSKEEDLELLRVLGSDHLGCFGVEEAAFRQGDVSAFEEGEDAVRVREGLGTMAGKGGMLRSVEDGLEGFGGGGREGGKVDRGGRRREGEHVRVLERDPLGHGLSRAVVRLEVLCEGVRVAPVDSSRCARARSNKQE